MCIISLKAGGVNFIWTIGLRAPFIDLSRPLCYLRAPGLHDCTDGAILSWMWKTLVVSYKQNVERPPSVLSTHDPDPAKRSVPSEPCLMSHVWIELRTVQTNKHDMLWRMCVHVRLYTLCMHSCISVCSHASGRTHTHARALLQAHNAHPGRPSLPIPVRVGTRGRGACVSAGDGGILGFKRVMANQSQSSTHAFTRHPLRLSQASVHSQPLSLIMWASSMMNLPSLYFWLLSNACSYFQPNVVLQFSQ